MAVTVSGQRVVAKTRDGQLQNKRGFGGRSFISGAHPPSSTELESPPDLVASEGRHTPSLKIRNG